LATLLAQGQAGGLNLQQVAFGKEPFGIA